MKFVRHEHAFQGYVFIGFEEEDRYFILTEDEFKGIKKSLGRRFNKNLPLEDFQKAYMVELL